MSAPQSLVPEPGPEYKKEFLNFDWVDEEVIVVLTNKKLGFIGGGNMAEALINGLLTSSFIDAKSIFVSEPSESKCTLLQMNYKIKLAADNKALVEDCDVIILAVKPQILRNILCDISSVMTEDKLVISVAAGVPNISIYDSLSGGGNKKFSVIRTMPNTPSLVQEGVTAIAPGEYVSEDEMKIAHRIFEAVGSTVDVQEGHLDAVTGVSGSGPAYIFMILEALSDAGVKMGLARDVANALTLQTVLGAAKLARETGKHPGELKDMVTSPAGTTIAALHALEKGGLRTTLMSAVEAATLRSRELGQIALKDNQKDKK